MNKFTIYHNPRCSKSRETLRLLESNGITPEIVHYLDTPPDKRRLTKLLKMLGISARELIRTSEEEYKAMNLANKQLSESDLIEAMAKAPKLIERPIVVTGDRAVLGRPPENVLNLL